MAKNLVKLDTYFLEDYRGLSRNLVYSLHSAGINRSRYILGLSRCRVFLKFSRPTQIRAVLMRG